LGFEGKGLTVLDDASLVGFDISLNANQIENISNRFKKFSKFVKHKFVGELNPN
jgi:hypothetical protein